MKQYEQKPRASVGRACVHAACVWPSPKTQQGQRAGQHYHFTSMEGLLF